MTACPFANQSRRYDAAYPGQRYTGGPAKGVLHTTETSVLPGYAGGGNAPHFTVVPDLSARTCRVYQHFDTDRPARALVDAAGGVQTNNDGAVQIELVGTCSAKGPGLFWPTAPEWALAPVRRLLRWVSADRGIPMLTPDQGWLSYPQSYGASPVRFTPAAWDRFAGWCGHQHVPENSHGDPGDLSTLFATLEEIDMTPSELRRIIREEIRAELSPEFTDYQRDMIGTTSERWRPGKVLGYIAGQAAAARRYAGRAAATGEDVDAGVDQLVAAAEAEAAADAKACEAATTAEAPA